MYRNLLVASLALLLASVSLAQMNPPNVNIPKGSPTVAPKPVAELAGNPELLDVTPAMASPGQTVTIRGKNLPMDKFQNEVWFTVAFNTSVQAKTLEVTRDQAIVTYKVQLLPKAGATGIYFGKVCMKPKDTGKETNSLPFQYVPAALPTITSTDPVRYAFRMTLFGTNFKPDDKVYLDTGEHGGPREAISKQYISATQVTVELLGIMDERKSTTICVSGKIGAEWVFGPAYKLTVEIPVKKGK